MEAGPPARSATCSTGARCWTSIYSACPERPDTKRRGRQVRSATRVDEHRSKLPDLDTHTRRERSGEVSPVSVAAGPLDGPVRPRGHRVAPVSLVVTGLLVLVAAGRRHRRTIRRVELSARTSAGDGSAITNRPHDP